MDEYIKWLFDCLFAVVLMLLGITMKRSEKRMDKMEERHDTLLESHKDCELNLANHKTHVSENYETKSHAQTNHATMQATVSRLHERIDELPKEIVAQIMPFIKK